MPARLFWGLYSWWTHLPKLWPVLASVFYFPKRPKSFRVEDLTPRWLPEEHIAAPLYGSRFQMGISLRCPCEAQPEHRISLWFNRPLDGLPPMQGVPLYELAFPEDVGGVDGSRELLPNVTVLNAKDDASPIDFSHCCKGWLVEGLLIIAKKP